MIRPTIGLLVLMLRVLAPSPGWTQEKSAAGLAASVDALVQPLADAGLLSGTILIARGDRVLVQRNYGFSNWELRVPVSASSRFAIASITKVMTAALVDILVKERRLDLDTPINRYIADFPKGPRGGAVTIRQLVQHQSGVPHRVTTAVDETQRLLPADIVERVKKTGLLFEPGTETLYSSAGYTTLARVIEIVEQKPFATVLRERIFQPSGMLTATDESSQQLMPDRALPYRFSVNAGKLVVANAPYKDLSFLTGAGSVYATAEDLLHFASAMGAGVLGSRHRISPSRPMMGIGAAGMGGRTPRPQSTCCPPKVSRLFFSPTSSQPLPGKFAHKLEISFRGSRPSPSSVCRRLPRVSRRWILWQAPTACLHLQSGSQRSKAGWFGTRTSSTRSKGGDTAFRRVVL